MKTTLLQRFETKINKTETCWLWTAATKENGYGHFNGKRDGLQSDYAHRISWELYRGLIPKGVQILHKCDNPSCVNPDHLFLGNQQDNMNDMSNKERGWWSKVNLCSKGHLFDMVTKSGKRRCKTCVLAKQREWYAKNGRKKGD